jgi:hypothetical protein
MYISQKTFGLSVLLQLLYPDISLGSRTAGTHSSHVSHKTAALHGTMCHGFLDAIMTYFTEFEVTTEGVKDTIEIYVFGDGK